MAAVDLISPFNKITIAGKRYSKDRGYAFEQELIAHSQGLLDTRIGDSKSREAAGAIPQIIYNSTILNDGRRLMISAQPITYLTQPEYALTDSISAPIDAIDFATLFEKQDALQLRTATALRMNASFPLILPVVKLPSIPVMNIMDAGLRDNFGTETATRFLHVHREWINANTQKVILLQIRDTRENEVVTPSEQKNLTAMLLQPLFAIGEKWQPFQSYFHSYLKDYAPHFLKNNLSTLTFQYIPEQVDQAAALNFHLTKSEKKNIISAMYRYENTQAAKWLTQQLQPKK